MTTSFDLDRFKKAQDSGDLEGALAELEAGRKRSHWIWYVFPQLRGLGSSFMAERYGLDGIAEARAYLEDPLLRARLCSAVGAAHAQLCGRGARIRNLMGSEIDALKLVSSMTLFERVAALLRKEQPAEDLARLGSMAQEILAAAAGQGFPPCASTRAQL